MSYRQLIAQDKTLVTYRPALRNIGGSIAGTILIQQIIYWDDKNNGSFYKFSSKCSHKLYVSGDSWEEELGMSAKEIRTALSHFAFKCGKKNREKYGEKYDEERNSALVQYYTDSNRVTHYALNRDVLSKLLLGVYKVTSDTAVTITETTTETTPTKVGASPAGQVEPIKPIKSKPSPLPKKRVSAPPSLEMAYIKSIWGALNAEMRKRGGLVFSKQQEYADFFAEVGLNNAKYAMEYLRSPQNMEDQYGWKTAAYCVKGLRSNWNKIAVKMREPLKPKPQADMML